MSGKVSNGSEVNPHIESPPTSLMGTLTRMGPGLIIAGSIVGSGELIATTKVGAVAGFSLLWLIILGCVIKVFAQVEIGRYTVTHGEGSLEALNKVPGPKILGGNWILAVWVLVSLTVITQQGGIVGGVGQALSIRFPLTANGEKFNELQDQWVKQQVELGQLYKQHHQALGAKGISITGTLELHANASDEAGRAKLTAMLGDRAVIVGDDEAQFKEIEQSVIGIKKDIDGLGEPLDAYLWATILGVFTSVVLYFGRYGLIQFVSTVFVGLFTVVTIITLVMLQTNPDWAVTGGEVGSGLTFSLPPKHADSNSPIFVALAAFGIIGVGATELIMYPYWCLEKGYAKSTGPRDDSPEWAARAKGWMRVMRFDAWASMVVYTFATVAFFLLGAAVLGRTGLNPGGKDLIRILSEMYVPVFGEYAPVIFLFGAFAVLYSTYFVGAAGNARMISDAAGVYGLHDKSDVARAKWTRIMSAVWPMIAVLVFWIVGFFMEGQSPAAMVLVAGVGGAILLPVVGVGALWFRYRRCVDVLRPGKLWDIALWISFVGFLIVGVVMMVNTIGKVF